MRFEDDSIESAKTVKQWNVKIISVGCLFKLLLRCLPVFQLLFCTAI
jgi:hypothetical protein